ncbi:MAG: hypothetical protein JXR91_02080 [Deltaproteobacteria bacterium]|nr:hypothetical protein [Deltaproteobacteria bacterium]
MKHLIFLALALVTFSISSNSQAGTVKELTYSESIIWRAAVRFIRVDSGYNILEKDKDSGYLLFEYKDGDMICNASFEIIPVNIDNKKIVRLQITVSGQPSYIESLLFTKLQRKLRHEYGFPPEAEYVNPPVDLTDPDLKSDKKTTKESGNSDKEEDLEVTEEKLDEEVE